MNIEKKPSFKSGFVVFIGRPNAGKSTLLNTFLQDKISIVSSIPQTTRHQIRGIANLKNAQIIFVDTPGIHRFRHKLANHLNSLAFKSLEDIEVILYVVDLTRRPGVEETHIMRSLIKQKIPIIMVLNKLDMQKKNITLYIDAWKAMLGRNKTDPVRYYVPVSAKTGKNIEELKEAVISLLPEGPPFYEPGTVTDFPLSFRVADIIREKIFEKLSEEIPHSLAVEVEEIEDKEKLVCIYAAVYVNRDSQKQIVIGKKGGFIKDVGIAARGEIETIFKKKVYLQLRVRVVKDWQTQPRILQELGYC
ncbi:MAG: GTPase Era [Candidatus Omnitrophica bacterium]|nr:GTPase Era [Candidatus Omnitrophota bacterium]